MAMTVSKDALCLKFALVAGKTAATNIAVTGITTDDTIIFAIEHGATAGMTDQTANMSISADGYVQCSTGTSGYYIAILWQDNDA